MDCRKIQRNSFEDSSDVRVDLYREESALPIRCRIPEHILLANNIVSTSTSQVIYVTMTGMSESFQSFENRVGWTTASQHYINVMYMKQLQVPSRIPEKVTISMQGVMSNSIVLPAESAVGTVRIDQRGVVSSSSNDGSDSEEEPLRRNRKVKCKEKGKEKESNRKKVTTTRERGGVQSIPSSSPKSPSRKRTRSISSTPTGSMSRLRLSTSPTNNRTDFIAYRPRNSSPTLDHQALQSGNNNIDQLEKLFDIS